MRKRSALALGPRSTREWSSGLAVSVPVALALWWARGDESSLHAMAAAAIVLSIPWIVPALMMVGVASSPLYMWLHTQGPVAPVLTWLGGVVLVAAVIGCHINGALLYTWWRRRRRPHFDPGLRAFLERRPEQH
jgi:hypothetical protein